MQKSFSTNDDIRATEQAAARTDWATSQGKTYYKLHLMGSFVMLSINKCNQFGQFGQIPFSKAGFAKWKMKYV